MARRFECKGCGYVTDDLNGTPCTRDNVGCGIGKMRYKWRNKYKDVHFSVMECNQHVCGYFYTEFHCPECDTLILIARDETFRKSTSVKRMDEEYLISLEPEERDLVLKNRVKRKIIIAIIVVVAILVAIALGFGGWLIVLAIFGFVLAAFLMTVFDKWLPPFR